MKSWPEWIIITEMGLVFIGIAWAIIGGLMDRRSDASEFDKNMNIADRNIKVIGLNVSLITLNVAAIVISRILK